ncbi:cytotoxic and regulatory T-cell molecule isoform X2 [Xyrichtys novacula]|uniref:Cytotoxic and regulatory T-cell molecule isoform X2 n=1 Tax=Xyrichtys novacula TaxID=13765 RepID=A0AAV1FVC2_XYRNO|nr:cytotoxic and regulatory T-cell molecule isoform X2 [Xyrichtys novacula]
MLLLIKPTVGYSSVCQGLPFRVHINPCKVICMIYCMVMIGGLTVILVSLIIVSLAVWQRVTVKKGQTVNLSCPITEAQWTNVEWRNPDGYIMFFSEQKALKDHRYTINKLSESEFSVSISNATFKDGGNYTCSVHGLRTIEKKVEVTVLGFPEMEVEEHEGKSVIKCTAEGNNNPPQIYWKFNNGPEFHAQAKVFHSGRSYISTDKLNFNSIKKRVTVKCLVRHPALYSRPLINFVKIGRDAQLHFSTTTSPSTTQTSGSTRALRTTSISRTSVNPTTTDVRGLSSEDSLKLSTWGTVPTAFPLTPVTSKNSPLVTTEDLKQLTPTQSTSGRNDSTSNATSTKGSFVNPEMQSGAVGSSSLLILLVTCLIVCLVVVVIFFAIKLRRAHLVWKRENEETNTSEESSKSKSSHEDRSTKQHRCRGFFNTEVRQYVVDEPRAVTSVVHVDEQPQTAGQTSAKCDIKETEL